METSNENLECVELHDQEKLQERVVDIILELIIQAKNIENISVENIITYDNIGDAKSCIERTDKKIKKARSIYDDLKKMPKSHFYTIGRNKAKIEKSQEVLDDMIFAIENNANATKALFNAQTQMAVFSKKLYGIGLMGIAANRMVVREIKLRLENASEEELSKLARRELEFIIEELKRQQSVESKIDSIENRIDYNYKEASKRLKLLENKTFLDSPIYKIVIGLISISALILSLI